MKKMKLKIVFVCFLIVLKFEPLSAQNSKLDEIIVTSGKTDSLSKNFPGSISVIDKLFMEEHGADTLEKLSGFVPNLYFKKTTSGDLLVSRGISTIDTSLFGPMGLYVDDIAYPVSYMMNKNLFDAERVEVLRGPQGTLYGRNSESGVINIITEKPDNNLKAKIFVEKGNYCSDSGGFFVKGPLLDSRLFAGISGFISSSDGYIENEITENKKAADETERFVSAKIRWAPGDFTDIVFAADVSDKDFGVSRLRFENGPDFSDRFKVRSSEADDSNEKNHGESLKLKTQVNGIRFVSVTGHRNFEKDFIHDFDRTFKKLGYSDMDLENESLSQELRILGVNNSGFEWISGVYAGKDKIDSVMELSHVNPVLAKKRITDSKNVSLAVFGQGSWHLSKKTSITLGLRLEKSEQEGSQTFDSFTGTSEYSDDLSESEVLPKASLFYELNQNCKIYLGYSKGWLQGGYNYFSATSKDNFSYSPEYTDNYEAGIKSAFFDNRLKTDFTIFYTDISDKQIREEVQGGGAGVWKFTNAAKAKTKGFEFEIKALPFKGFEINAGTGFALSEVDKWKSGSFDYSGNSLPWAPELTYSLGLGYFFKNGVYFTGDMSGCSKRYFDAANSLEDDGYVLFGLKSGFRYKSYDISIWCKNLFDEEYINKKVENNMGYTMVEDGEPRVFGLTISWRI